MATPYENWKGITDQMYAGKLSEDDATYQLIVLLAANGTNTRGADHTLLAKSYWVYDKEDWATKTEKPLGLGLVYMKPDKTKTQDIFIALPSGEIEKYYTDYEMLEKYPSMAGVHKKNLPIK